MYIENSNGIIQTNSSPENTESWRVPEDFFGTWQEDIWTQISINNETAIIAYKKIKNTDWRVVLVLPLKEILSSSIYQRNILIIIMIALCAVAYLLAYFVSASSTKRIHNLTEKMRLVQDGNLDITIQNKGKDEIGELYENFNFMVKKMNALIEEQYRIGQEVRTMELKRIQAELNMLQSQINPHLLYNTLDLINWLAIEHGRPDIESVILALSRFYKLSLSKGRDIVTIGDEILHVQTYIQIQNFRFKDSVKLELDADSVCNYKIPKMTLQPLVENAILHGIQKKPERTGAIRISGKLENDNIILCIQDDGIGMTEEQIQMLFLNDNSDSSYGYGVRNINERLKLYFGNPYGLTYKSMPGSGTTVEIKIPPV